MIASPADVQRLARLTAPSAAGRGRDRPGQLAFLDVLGRGSRPDLDDELDQRPHR